jgi:hypothetical protein
MTSQEVDPSTVFVDYRPRPGRRKAVLIGLGVALLLVAVVFAVRATVSSPESAVHGYFDALADRDVEGALAAAAPEVREQVARDLISSAVLRSDSYAPPRDVAVTELTVDGRSAVAEVDYTIDGRKHSATLRLRRDEGILDAVFHRWLVVDGIGSVLLGDVPEQITVNGEQIAAYDAQGPRVLPALPGGYQVGVPEGDPLWEPRSVQVRVEPQNAAEVSVPLAARPEVREEIDRQIAERLDGCAASTELVPPGCPFGYAVVVRAEDVRWRITEYPRVELSAGRELGEMVIVVGTSAEGEAVIAGTRRFVGEFEQSVPFPVSGTATVAGDSVLFQPEW